MRNATAGAAMSVTIVDGAVAEVVGVPGEVVARAEQLADEGRVLNPGVELPGVRLSLDHPALAALTFQHAARSSGPSGAPVYGWFGFDGDGVLVTEPPESALVGNVALDPSVAGDLEMPPG